MKWPQLSKGAVINLSEVDLLVIETTTNEGKANKPPAVVHRLKPGYRSPADIDADGFKRADGFPIEQHASWIKFRSNFTATVTGSSDKLKVDVWFKMLVGDREFGEYEVDPNPEWGQNIHTVTDKIQRKKKTVGYLLDSHIRVSMGEAINLYHKGALTNVTLVNSPSGSFLRTLPDHDSSNNLGIIREKNG